MLLAVLAHLREIRPTLLVLANPLARELAGLDLFKDLLHFLAGALGNDALAEP